MNLLNNGRRKPSVVLSQNESFCSFHAAEVKTGKYLAVFEKSRLLEYLPTAVDAGLLEHAEPWKHYGIAQAEPVIYQQLTRL